MNQSFWVRFGVYFRLKWRLYIMLLIPSILVFIFNYIPLYGLVIAFQNYNPGEGILGSEWVGIKWFQVVFSMPDFKYILRNTVLIAVGKILAGTTFSILFALLLNEIGNKIYKRTIQTITYFPHFLSWVIVGGVFTDMLLSKGIINQFLAFFGIAPIFFLGDVNLFQPTIIILETWKEFGWGAIVYLAAMSRINPELYEAATIDGANRFKQTIYVTLPSIAPIIMMIAVLNIGNVLNAGFEQVLVLYNPAVYQTGDILDTFIYRQGLLDAQYSLSTAIGLFKSIIGLTLTLTANYLAVRFTDYRIF